jgi:hypothetical protein
MKRPRGQRYEVQGEESHQQMHGDGERRGRRREEEEDAEEEEREAGAGEGKGRTRLEPSAVGCVDGTLGMSGGLRGVRGARRAGSKVR